MVVSVLAGLVVVRVAGAQSPRTAGSSTLGITAASGYAFDPNAIQQVPTNSTITVTFTDAGSLAHTFTIIGREGWVIPSSYTVSQFDNVVFGKAYPSLFNLNVSGSGTQVSGSFTSPGPGWYEFVCTEGGHWSLGMYGFIAFGMNLPSNLTVSSGQPGIGSAVFIITGSIASLVVIALVLGFVVGRREGAKHEMPPERLGYAEPPSAGGPLPPSPGAGRHT